MAAAHGPQAGAKRLLSDLFVWQWRPRRVHDMRRTFISLARAAGVEKELLRRATHCLRNRDVMELYTSVEWELLCSELSKLRVHRREQLALAAGGDPFADPIYSTYRQHTNEARRSRGAETKGP